MDHSQILAYHEFLDTTFNGILYLKITDVMLKKIYLPTQYKSLFDKNARRNFDQKYQLIYEAKYKNQKFISHNWKGEIATDDNNIFENNYNVANFDAQSKQADDRYYMNFK